MLLMKRNSLNLYKIFTLISRLALVSQEKYIYTLLNLRKFQCTIDGPMVEIPDCNFYSDRVCVELVESML